MFLVPYIIQNTDYYENVSAKIYWYTLKYGKTLLYALCYLGCKNQFSFQLEQGHTFRLEKEGIGCFECACKENIFGDLYSECIQNSKCFQLDCDKTQLFTPAGQCCPVCSEYPFKQFFVFLCIITRFKCFAVND